MGVIGGLQSMSGHTPFTHTEGQLSISNQPHTPVSEERRGKLAYLKEKKNHTERSQIHETNVLTTAACALHSST